MYAKVYSASIYGITGHLVEVEVDIANGLPQFDIVGLPDSSVREARERVRSALRNSRFSFPLQRITTNLAPADLKKEGSAFDLAIALGILIADGQLIFDPAQDGTPLGDVRLRERTVSDTSLNGIEPLTDIDNPLQMTHQATLEEALWIGELALDGSLRAVSGVLAMVMEARERDLRCAIVPHENAEEARLVEGIEVISFHHLEEVVRYFAGEHVLQEVSIGPNEGVISSSQQKEAIRAEHAAQDDTPVNSEASLDFADIKGQYQAKRALEVAAAGMHNLLMIGPPGSGKTMLARSLPSILPELSLEEALEVTKIYSVAGLLKKRGHLITRRPFRAPHHTITTAGLTGGGIVPRPGEVSLAHRGVLFLDELPEFGRHVLEVLRQPLEDREVTISRARMSLSYPASFMLVASMNPCPCGFYGSEDLQNPCTCTPLQIRRYRAKISGPLLDRLDIHIEVPRVNFAVFASEEKTPTSQEIRARLEGARQIQRERFQRTGTEQFNAQMNARQVRTYCTLHIDATDLLRQSFEVLGLSARAHDRILKVARTIADLDGCEQIDIPHLAEAIQYRSLDKKMTG